MKLLAGIFFLGPLIFGLAFIAPLTEQVLLALSVMPPLGITPLTAGFVLGGVWGGIATARGRWI